MITAEDKSYVATIQLGEITNTLDTEGDIIETKPVPELTSEIIEKTIKTFLGKTFQIPPMFSAKKVKGQRLYKLARKNIEVKREPVEIQINEITLDKFSENKLTFSATCSKGTYVRVLGKDIAEKLGTVGYLLSLTRTRVGGFCVEDSQSLDEFQSSWISSVS